MISKNNREKYEEREKIRKKIEKTVNGGHQLYTS